MRYYWRLFLWENGAKSTEYSDYIIAPIFLEDKLDETLDSGEVILKSMPISTRTAFPPKTKFRIERYAGKDAETPQKTWDMIVEHDDVEELEGCPEICTHRIYLIEASAVAQYMHVDNIALTYELQDVDLSYRTITEDTTIIGSDCESQLGGYNTAYCQYDSITISSAGIGQIVQINEDIYFIHSYRYVWDDSSLNSIKSLMKTLSAEEAHEISFTVPKLICQGAEENGAWSSVGTVDLFEVNTRTRVYEVLMLNGVEQSRTLITTKRSGAASFEEYERDDEYCKVTSTYAYIRSMDDFSTSSSCYFPTSECYSTFSALGYAASSYSDKTITFTTKVLSQAKVDEGYYYKYEIECYAYPWNSSGFVSYYEKQAAAYYYQSNSGIYVITDVSCSSKGTVSELEDEENVYVKASFVCCNMANVSDYGAFLTSATKYSAYELFQKALLTVDTQIIANAENGTNTTGIDSLADSYPIVLNSEWESKLKSTTTYETTFEEKNLWEVLLQIGYYLHAVPYLEFKDGTDQFVLNFRQLGATTEKADTNTKITVFNSRNLSEFFTQYDSYVTNLFSPQNEVDEWLVAKTSDDTYLVSNDTAELQTSRPILEIEEFDITYNGETESALNYIFEESVYSVLTSDNPMRIKPAKGNALYYTLGDNIITGLTYTPPSVNDGDYYYALQEICRRLFGLSKPEELKFNKLLFHIKYKAQDELRLTQIRPDIQNFMKNSSYEKYPHHEQFYGQQDKIVDSERFSYNLFGRLIRVGNAVYQRQEYAALGDEKEAGDLVTIYGEPYYVTEVENEYYPDVVLQKVTYSKNFNQLSNIVTIPSEPRFYEVSERSKIRREVRLMDFIELSSTKPTEYAEPRFLSKTGWKDFIKKLLFYSKDEYTLPNFAYTKFMADYTRKHTGSSGTLLDPEELFPSSEVDRSDANNVVPKSASDHSACIVSLLYFPLHDGILFEWDMADNFGAGDFVDPDTTTNTSTEEDAYYAQQSYRYVDVMGRADFFTFRLFQKDDWSLDEAQQLPKAVYEPAESECDIYLPSPNGIALDKDNREAISFNYQINLLHRPTDDDKEDFFTFSNLFGQKDSSLKMALLSEPQSLFSNSVSTTAVLADDVTYELVDDDDLNAIEVRITAPSGVNLSEVQSIVIYQVDDTGGRYVYISKNVTQKEDEDKLSSWWIFPVYSD